MTEQEKIKRRQWLVGQLVDLMGRRQATRQQLEMWLKRENELIASERKYLNDLEEIS